MNLFIYLSYYFSRTVSILINMLLLEYSNINEINKYMFLDSICLDICTYSGNVKKIYFV